jgi:hypothetical protein
MQHVPPERQYSHPRRPQCDYSFSMETKSHIQDFVLPIFETKADCRTDTQSNVLRYA